MKKRLISLLVALCMAVTLLPVSAITAWAEEGGSTLKPLQFKGGFPVLDDITPTPNPDGHEIYTGDGWSYDGSTKTLDLHPDSPTEYDLKEHGSIRDYNSIACSTIIGENATIVNGSFWDNKNPGSSITNHGTITSGTYSMPVINHGTITDGTFYSSVSNESEGKIVNGNFLDIRNLDSRITNNGAITSGTYSMPVINYGTIENGIIKKAFDNYGTVKNSYFTDSFYKVTNHNGSMPGCLFTGTPEGIEFHTITEVEGYYISASLADISFEVMQNKFYFTGFPTVRVNLVKDGHVKPVTSINQKLNYGDLIEDSNSSPVSYIFTVENDNEDVVLNQGTYPTLKMASNGTPIIDGAYYSTIESNIPTYFGDGWHCQKAMDSVGTLYLEKGTYDFRSTDPVNKNGEPLNAVICSIVNEGGTIEDGTFSKPIVNGQPGSTSSKPHEIEGGTFAAGLLYNDGVITGGAFNGKDSVLNKLLGSTVVSDTALSGDYRSVTVNGGAILKVNDTHPLVPDETGYDLVQGTAWDLYSYAGTVLTVEADADITNINGQEIGKAFSSIYPNGETDKTVVRFEMPDSDVELNSTKIVVPDPKPEPKPEPEPEAPTYTLTVKGGTFTYNGGEAMTSASVPVDAEVKVTLNQSAVPEGMVFDLWAMDEASLLGNPAVAYNEESFTIPAGSVAKGSTVTVEAQYRDATIESEPSILGTAAIIGVAGAGTAVIVWQGYRIGMELYEKYFQPTPEETAAEQPAPEAPAAAAAS